MYSHQVCGSNGGLAPKIYRVSIRAKLDGYSYEQALSRCVQMYFPTVMYSGSHQESRKCSFLLFVDFLSHTQTFDIPT